MIYAMNMQVILIVGIFIIIILGIICMILGVRLYDLILGVINYAYIKKVEEKGKKKGEKYVAVVLTNKILEDKLFIYPSGIKLLLMCIKKNKIPYILMKKFDIKKFRELIYDEKCYRLYIIGHGCRHGLKVDKNEMLYYCSFKDAPKKEFVAQLHCNHNGGESLADIIALNKDKSYVTDKKRYTWMNRRYCRKLLKDTKPPHPHQ